MKVDEKIREELIEGLQHSSKETTEFFEYIIKDIRNAKTVEEIMHLKQQLLIGLISCLPTGRRHCYFCLLHRDNCNVCEYAKYHGACAEDGSDYTKISDALDGIADLIRELYFHYREEDYDKAKEELEAMKNV